MKDNTAPYDVYLHTENKGRFSIGSSSKKVLVNVQGSIQYWGAEPLSLTIEGTDQVPVSDWIDIEIGNDGGVSNMQLMNQGYDLEINAEANTATVKGVVTVNNQEYQFGKSQVVKAKSGSAVTWKVNNVPIAYGKSLLYTPQPGDSITAEAAETATLPYATVEEDGQSFVVYIPETGNYEFMLRAADGTYGTATVANLEAGTQYQVTLTGMDGKTLTDVTPRKQS